MDAAISRPQRIGLGVAGAGFLLSVAGAVILQIDPSRMLDAHHILHRTGMAVMLAGLTTFLIPSIARRHRDRAQRTVRALLDIARFGGAPALRAVGAALMAFAIAGEIVVRIAGGPGGFFPIVAGTPGLLIWLTGIILAVGGRRANRPRRRPAPRDRRDSGLSPVESPNQAAQAGKQ